MSRPATRLLTMLELLQDGVGGRELAVDGRTVRRHATTLGELGIPVEVWLDTTRAEIERRLPATSVDLEDDPRGGVVLRTHATDLDGMARILAMFGCRVAVREPDELRDALARLGALLSASALRGA